MTELVVFWGVLFIVCFSFMLNLFISRGALMQLAGTILGVIMFGMVIASVFVFGWVYAIPTFLFSWMFVAMSKPLVAKLATKLTGRRVGMWLPDPAREAFDEFMHGKAPMDDVFKRMSKQAEETETHLARIAASPAIDFILSQNKITPADLKKLHRLLIHSNLSDIAWEILSSPDDLRKLIEFHKGGVHPRDIHTQFRQRKLGTGDKNERLQQNER